MVVFPTSTASSMVGPVYHAVRNPNKWCWDWPGVGLGPLRFVHETVLARRLVERLALSVRRSLEPVGPTELAPRFGDADPPSCGSLHEAHQVHAFRGAQRLPRAGL